MTQAHRIITLLAAAALSAFTLAAPAAADPPEPETIATGLVGPLQLDVGHHGDIYVAQAFAGLLSRIDNAGTVTTLYAETTGVGGISAGRAGVAYTVRGDDPAAPLAELRLLKRDGSVKTIADLAAYESDRNPDRRNVYGFRGLSAGCLAQVPPDFHPYQGAIDSNPYALLATRRGWYVADAGANAVLHVSRSGQVKTVAVFRPQKTAISAEVAASFGLPECVVGERFAFEPVPTDVEYGRNGRLVVSLLPGGPEDASLGARGAVAVVGQHGQTWVVARGFLGATNVAVGPRGQIYVAELFGNKISVWKHGHTSTVVDVPSPAGLEWARGRLIATTDVFGAGNVVAIRP